MSNPFVSLLRRRLVLPLGWVLAVAPAAYAHHSAPEAAAVALQQHQLKIKIVIIIIIKKNGLAEISDIRAARDGMELKANMILAEADVAKGQLMVKPLRMGFEPGKATMLAAPEGFVVSQAVAQQMGAKDSFRLKAGKFELKADRMGNFEIQD